MRPFLRGGLLWLEMLLVSSALAQTADLYCEVIDERNEPIAGATVQIVGDDAGQITDSLGEVTFQIPMSTDIRLIVSHVSFQSLDTLLSVGTDNIRVSLQLFPAVQVLEGVEVTDSTEQQVRQNAITVDPRSARNLPSAFNDFSKVLATLPGVSSNNELSSTYSVRGGNFDENLVYVNDIPIYRPFLANSGRQEGLSFVNPDLVKNIDFYAGGWEARYGDKLSSSLNITYKEPDAFRGAASVGLLGGSVYVGGAGPGERARYLVGFRHRDSRYLLNSLEVQGEYFPRFTDLQSMVTIDLTKKSSNYTNRSKLHWLTSYGRNRYLTEPTSQLTEFGSVTRNFRLQTAFDGRELLNYDTWQSGIRFGHWISSGLKTNLIASAVYTREEENFEVEGAYRLCDVDNNPSSPGFENCVIVRGIGAQFDYGRNELEATIFNLENRFEWIVSDKSVLEWGLGARWQEIDDQIREYSFVDSADFVSLTHDAFNTLALKNEHYFGFVQFHFFSADSLQEVNAGIRANHWTQTDQLLFSPRLLYRVKPNWRQTTHFNFSVGSYQQHPFYRELRDFSGQTNTGIEAQRSVHLIAGVDRFMTIWERPFLLSVQGYYKFLTDIIPYDVDNLRLRYFAENNASGYATGFDVRFNGAFIPGTQSWFSLGLLKTVEDIEGDGRAAVRRPLDQRLNLGAYFEDHLPNDPTVRVYVSMNFGSGYPFGPPGNAAIRNVFSGDEYYRADIGLSKAFRFPQTSLIDACWLRLEVLNALGADNTLSYTWIEDVTGASFAIPNSLSARLLNVRFSVDF